MYVDPITSVKKLIALTDRLLVIYFVGEVSPQHTITLLDWLEYNGYELTSNRMYVIKGQLINQYIVDYLLPKHDIKNFSIPITIIEDTDTFLAIDVDEIIGKEVLLKAESREQVGLTKLSEAYQDYVNVLNVDFNQNNEITECIVVDLVKSIGVDGTFEILSAEVGETRAKELLKDYLGG